MKCPYCNQEINENSIRCDNCKKIIPKKIVYCDVCNKLEPIPYQTNFYGEAYVCNNCILRINSLRLLKTKGNNDKLKKSKERIKDEMIKQNFPIATQKKIIAYIDTLISNTTTKEEKKEKDRIARENAKINLEEKKEVHLLTTGYNFEHYNIIKYNGLVFGESVIGTGIFSSITSNISDTFGVESNSYNGKLAEARKNAQDRAIFQSIVLGGNAIIGIDVDYINFTDDKIGVVFNGTSVTIEKKEEENK